MPEFQDERGAVKLFEQDLRLFMPRVGIAWRPIDKTVIRMGGGWFDNINHMNTLTILNLMPPKSGSDLYQTFTNPALTIPVVGANGQSFNIQTRQYRPDSNRILLDDPLFVQGGATAAQRAANVTMITPEYNDGGVYKWSFDVQRELTKSTVVTIGYVGTKGVHVGNSVGNFNNPGTPSTNTNIQGRRPTSKSTIRRCRSAESRPWATCATRHVRQQLLPWPAGQGG